MGLIMYRPAIDSFSVPVTGSQLYPDLCGAILAQLLPTVFSTVSIPMKRSGTARAFRPFGGSCFFRFFQKPGGACIIVGSFPFWRLLPGPLRSLRMIYPVPALSSAVVEGGFIVFFPYPWYGPGQSVSTGSCLIPFTFSHISEMCYPAAGIIKPPIFRICPFFFMQRVFFCLPSPNGWITPFHMNRLRSVTLFPLLPLPIFLWNFFFSVPNARPPPPYGKPHGVEIFMGICLSPREGAVPPHSNPLLVPPVLKYFSPKFCSWCVFAGYFSVFSPVA